MTLVSIEMSAGPMISLKSCDSLARVAVRATPSRKHKVAVSVGSITWQRVALRTWIGSQSDSQFMEKCTLRFVEPG